jgi:hypothetical protein
MTRITHTATFLLCGYAFSSSFYIPSQQVSISCLGRLFHILTVHLEIAIHLTQSVIYRMWFMIPSACFGGALEVLGWSARVWSTKNIHLSTPFTIQYAS